MDVPMCLNCGTVMHAADARSHVCDPADLPAAGKPVRFARSLA